MRFGFQVVVYVGGWPFRSELMTKHSAEQCAIDFKLRNPNSQPAIEEIAA